MDKVLTSLLSGSCESTATRGVDDSRDPNVEFVENSTLASMWTAEAPQLLFIDNGSAHGDELMG